MSNSKYLTSLSIALMIGLSGCGGGSGSGSGSTSTSGVVSGSFYEGVTVCFDTNNDGSCNGESSIDTSNSKGEFTLKGNNNYSIIAEIKPGSIKHEVIGDNGVSVTANDKTIFAIPANAIAKAKAQGNGKVVISAISTKLYTYVKEHNRVNIDEAMQIVANSLGIDKDKLLVNFNDSNIDENTRVLLKQKAEALYNTIKGKNSINEIENSINNFVGSMRLPHHIDIIHHNN